MVLGSGWGSTATFTATGFDSALIVSVTTGGSGLAANAQITVTFKDGTFTNAPVCQITRGDVNAPGSTITSCSTSATTATLFFNGVPVTATTYTFDITQVGK